jgi:hypothetical protein
MSTIIAAFPGYRLARFVATRNRNSDRASFSVLESPVIAWELDFNKRIPIALDPRADGTQDALIGPDGHWHYPHNERLWCWETWRDAELERLCGKGVNHSDFRGTYSA